MKKKLSIFFILLLFNNCKNINTIKNPINKENRDEKNSLEQQDNKLDDSIIHNTNIDDNLLDNNYKNYKEENSNKLDNINDKLQLQEKQPNNKDTNIEEFEETNIYNNQLDPKVNQSSIVNNNDKLENQQYKKEKNRYKNSNNNLVKETKECKMDKNKIDIIKLDIAKKLLDEINKIDEKYKNRLKNLNIKGYPSSQGDLLHEL